MKEFLSTIGIVIGLICIIAFGMLMYKVERQFNYDSSYKSMVQKTVRDMVKQDALK